MITQTQERLEQLSQWYLAEQLPFDKQLIRLNHGTLRPFFRGTSCLEIGPADGTMTPLLLGEFALVDVVDGSQRLLDTIPRAANLRKFCCLFEMFEPDRRYDTILMSHILEHMEHPVELLRRVRDWMHPESILIVSVPNATSLHRLAGVKMGMLRSEYELNDRDRALGHFRVYDLDRLSKDLQSANFTVRQTGGVFLKPVSQGQIDASWDAAMIQAYFELGKEFPRNAAEIYATASL
jgi:2-polyprenyl-3-methyl-5-hydroxy-6-metoxy-1,4-benzoquinol methylase